MLVLIIYLIGSMIAAFLPKEIVKLGYKTMRMKFNDDKTSFFYDEDESEVSSMVFRTITIAMSWVSVIIIYVTTIFIIFIHKFLSK